MNGTKQKLTGKTVRQELLGRMVNLCNVDAGLTVGFALEVALDGSELAEVGSLKRSYLAYWSGMSGASQMRLLAQVRRIVVRSDRLIGRRVKR